MKRDEERARKMWRDIGVAAMQHGPNSLHHHHPGPVSNGNPHWNQPGYRNSYSLPHPTSQNGGERGGGGGGGSRYQPQLPHYDIKPLSQAPSFPEISSASYNGNGYHGSGGGGGRDHPLHHHHQQQQQQHHLHGIKPPRPLSMYELNSHGGGGGGGHHLHHNGNGHNSPQQLHSLPPNFVPHQPSARNGGGGGGQQLPPLSPSSSAPLLSSNGGGGGRDPYGMVPRSPTSHVTSDGGGRALLQQPEELVSWKKVVSSGARELFAG